jgi:N-acetylmuramoyl-L-alanine amidase
MKKRSQLGRQKVDEGITSALQNAPRESIGKPAVIWDSSPNCASREQERIQFLVLHNTDGPFADSLAHLKNPASRVSAHYIIDRTGYIYQLVPDAQTSWNSGDKRMNQQSIGVEVVASEALQNFALVQESALVALAKFLMDAYDLPVSNVILHRAVSSTDCPRWVWEDDTCFESWKATRLLSR